LSAHNLAGKKSIGSLLKQALSEKGGALGLPMRTAVKSLWKLIDTCAADQTLRSTLLTTWLHIFHTKVPRCLVKADDSNNYMQADDPFYVDGNYLNPHRLVVKSSFDCRLPVEVALRLGPDFRPPVPRQDKSGGLPQSKSSGSFKLSLTRGASGTSSEGIKRNGTSLTSLQGSGGQKNEESSSTFKIQVR
jgi:hypothetical protein